MKYSTFWTDPATKDLGKLPKPVAQRIFDKVNSIVDDPYCTAERCEGSPYCHQRIGAYRAILKIDDFTMVISIVKVGPRKNVYDR